MPKSVKCRYPLLSSINTLIVKHEVLWLDIPMNDILTMHELQSLANTRRKKPYLLLCELVLLANMIPQIPTRHQVHYQVQRVPVLKSLSHVHQKPVLQVCEQLSLISHRIDTLLCHDPVNKNNLYTAFDIYFIAYKMPVFFYSTLYTRPNPPLPIT